LCERVRLTRLPQCTVDSFFIFFPPSFFFFFIILSILHFTSHFISTSIERLSVAVWLKTSFFLQSISHFFIFQRHSKESQWKHTYWVYASEQCSCLISKHLFWRCIHFGEKGRNCILHYDWRFMLSFITRSRCAAEMQCVPYVYCFDNNSLFSDRNGSKFDKHLK
jgi:hypothetical protein